MVLSLSTWFCFLCDSIDRCDFFTFCGHVSSVRVFADPSNAPHHVAVIEFDDVEALTTAMLLEGALIDEKPISLVAYSGQIDANRDFVEVLRDKPITKRSGGAKEASASGRLAAMKAAGICGKEDERIFLYMYISCLVESKIVAQVTMSGGER